MIMKIRIIRGFCLLTAFMLGGIMTATAQDIADSTEESEVKVKPKRKLTKWGACIEGSIMGNSDMLSFGWGLQGCYRFNTNFNVG